MVKDFKIIIALLLLVFTGCSNKYDDSSLWKDIDQIYKDLDALKERVDSFNSQLALLDQVINGSAITSVTQDEEGNYTIHYKDQNNVEQSLTIATKEEMPEIPVIGIKEENGKWYWSKTIKGTTSFLEDKDGSKIPVEGRTPVLDIDTDGYWTINGVRITDKNGSPVKAEGKDMSLITGVKVSEAGTVDFTLGDGTVISANIFNAFNLLFDIETLTQVEDIATPLIVNYQLIGEKASDAILEIVKCEGILATLKQDAKTITITFPENFEKGSMMMMLYDLADNVIIKPLYFEIKTEETTKGISSAKDLMDFAQAFNSGASIAKYRDESGAIVLNNDIDMAGITSWIPIGKATTTVVEANKTVTYTCEKAFDGIFDGKGFSIKNIDWQIDCSDGTLTYGLFGALRENAIVRNLTLGSSNHHGRLTINGDSPQGTAIGAIAGYCESATIENCINYTDIAFSGENQANRSVRVGGIAGVMNGGMIGGETAEKTCINKGDITCGQIVNIGAGANSAFHAGGIVGFTQTATSTVKNCRNDGNQSVPSGRGGGIVGTANGGTFIGVINNGFIQDDVKDVFASNSARYNVKRMGGLAGGIASTVKIERSVNNGKVFSQNGCRTGGFVGHNDGVVSDCTNNGTILSDNCVVGTNLHGAGWACGYNNKADGIVNCIIGGKVGDYSLYKSNPENTPAATYSNAVRHGKFDPALNGFNNLSPEYYDWEIVGNTISLATGVNYTEYRFKNIAQHIFVIEADLTNPKIEIATVLADDLVPNPNGNNSSNNGKNLRETLSETCNRRRNAGQQIIAGINTGFFDSHNGIPRGFHIEEGEAAFINNPAVRAALVNHKPGFTVFEDKQISFENRSFKGLLKVADQEFEYYSINDTILRNGSNQYDANLYTHRLKKNPHAGQEVVVGSNALFIVGKNQSSMLVNKGYANATITAIIDGRNMASIDIPYVENKDEWVMQVTGEKADQLKAILTNGATVQICSTVAIGGDDSKPILTHNSSMYRFLHNGAWGNLGMSDDKMPATVAGMDETGNKLFWVVADGRSTESVGLTYYELYKTCQKLGAYNMIRFDGGGSSTMWIYNDNNGKVVNTPSDTNGERSCLNYFHLRIKE